MQPWIGPLSVPEMAFQANHPPLADSGIVDDTGRQIKAVAGPERESCPGMGQAEGDGAPDNVDHLI
jgi:hypothetical protein